MSNRVGSCTDVVNYFSRTAIQCAFESGATALGAHFFTKFNPKNGAIFGGLACLINKLTDLFFNGVFDQAGSSEDSRLVGRVLSFVTATAIAVAACGAFGIHLTLMDAVILRICGFIAGLLATWVIQFISQADCNIRIGGRA